MLMTQLLIPWNQKTSSFRSRTDSSDDLSRDARLTYVDWLWTVNPVRTCSVALLVCRSRHSEPFVREHFVSTMLFVLRSSFV